MLTLLIGLLLSAPSTPQFVGGELGTHYRVTGGLDDYLGQSVDIASDVNGDGYADFVIGEPLAMWSGSQTGSAYVHSGKDGALLYRFNGDDINDQFGYSVASADADGDGYSDIIIGAIDADPNGWGGAGSVFVFSGWSGTLLHRFDGLGGGSWCGYAVAGLDDLDGDGCQEILIGSKWDGSSGVRYAGLARVFSGGTGAELFRVSGRGEDAQLGSAVASAGDVDGDGVSDFLIGSPAGDVAGMNKAGHADVYSGNTWQLLWRYEGSAQYEFLGHGVAGLGDVNSDGCDDFAIGIPGRDGDRISAGMVIVYSGRTGVPIWSYEGTQDHGDFGFAISKAGDTNGDSTRDLVVSDPTGNGRIFVFNGSTWQLLWSMDGSDPGSRFGESVAGGHDVDGDGFADMAVGSPGDNIGQQRGEVVVVGLDPFLETSGTQLSISSGGSILLDLGFPSSTGNYPYQVLISGTGTGPLTLVGIEVPLSWDQLVVNSLMGLYPPQTTAFAGVLDAQGAATAQVTAAPKELPAHLAGRVYYMAAVTWGYSSIARELLLVQ